MKIAVIRYKPNTVTNDEHSLMLGIIQKQVRKYISLGISSCTKLWYFKKNVPTRNHPHKELIETMIAQQITIYLTKLVALVSNQKIVNPHALIQAVEVNTRSKTNQVFTFFDQVIGDFSKKDFFITKRSS